VALYSVLWSRSVGASTIAPVAQLLAGVTGVTGVIAILRPVIVGRWWINKDALTLTMRRELDDADHVAETAAAEMRAAHAKIKDALERDHN